MNTDLGLLEMSLDGSIDPLPTKKPYLSSIFKWKLSHNSATGFSYSTKYIQTKGFKALYISRYNYLWNPFLLQLQKTAVLGLEFPNQWFSGLGSPPHPNTVFNIIFFLAKFKKYGSVPSTLLSLNPNSTLWNKLILTLCISFQLFVCL